ncbi:MAG: tetratricopeptide repeat protein [Planctomycetota bacterium]
MPRREPLPPRSKLLKEAVGDATTYQAPLIAVVALVAVMTVVTHWPALSAQAVMSDDDMYVHMNPLVRNPSPAAAWQFLTEVLTPSTVGGYYQPLAMISLMVDYSLGGRPDDYRVFHATSLVLHAACAGLVVLLMFSLFGDAWAAGAVGLLFGLHPGAVESVAWVSDRKTVLASFFALGSLICYVKYAHAAAEVHSKGRTRWYIGCLFLFLLALMSKPTVTMLPLALCLLDVWPLGRIGRRAIVEKIPLLAMSVVFGVITIISQGRTADVVNPVSYPWWATPLVLCHNIVFYLWKIVWPVGLSAYYPWPEPFNLSQGMVKVGLVVTVGLVGVLLVSLRWTRAWMTGFLFFLIVIFPAMGLIGFTSSIAADRFSYLPKVGLLLPLAWLLKNTKLRDTAMTKLMALLVTVGCIMELRLTRDYLRHWTDTERMMHYMVDREPTSAFLLSGLGNVLSGAGQFDEAAGFYRRALEQDDDPAAHAGLATQLAAAGKLQEAEQHLLAAVRLHPKLVGAVENLAIVQDRLGKTPDAIEHFEAALLLKPHSVNALFNYGMLHFRRGHMDDARAKFLAALAVDPAHAMTHYQLGCLLVSQGRSSEGLDEWRRAIRQVHPQLDTMNNLAWILATADDDSLRNGSEAVAVAEQGCALTNRQDPALLDTLAAAYAEAKRFNDAVVTAEQSVARWRVMSAVDSEKEVARRLEGYRAGRPHRESINREAYLAR